MKILLLGPDGQLGWELQRSLAPLGQVIARNRASGADLSEPQTLGPLVRSIAPQVIVNAAAYTAVDRAESEPEIAQRVNAQAPGVLAELARQCQATLVHYSTDYVFDGSGERAWRESDQAAPLSVYGQSKLAGERALTAQLAGSQVPYVILRTSWVYAARGNNFARTMLRLGCERQSLTVVSDQWGAPTGAELLADVTAHVLTSLTKNAALSGLYHVSASGVTNWYEYARFVFERARVINPQIPLKVEQVLATTTSQWPTAAKRPLNSRLDSSRLEQAFRLQMPPWQQAVQRMLDEIITKTP